MCTGQFRVGKMWEEVDLPKAEGPILFGEEVDFSRISDLLRAYFVAPQFKFVFGNNCKFGMAANQ